MKNPIAIFDNAEFTPRLVLYSPTQYTLYLGETENDGTRFEFELSDVSEREDTWHEFKFKGQRYDLNIWEMDDTPKVGKTTISAEIYAVFDNDEHTETDTSNSVSVVVLFAY